MDDNEWKEGTGKFFNSERKYTRHIRKKDEFARDPSESNSIYDMRPAPKGNAPEVSHSRRARISKLNPTEIYEDPTGDRAPMPATADEILQFGQDITSSEFAEALKKKLGVHSAGVNELFLGNDDDDEDHDRADDVESVSSASTVKTVDSKKESKNKRRRRRKGRTQLLFSGVPKVPEDKYDHFFHIAAARVTQFKKNTIVQQCMIQLLPYLYLHGSDWKSKNLSFDDVIGIGKQTGLYYIKTHRAVEDKYIVHVYSDEKPPEDEQLQDYDVLLFLVAGKLKNAGCYCILKFYFIKGDSI